MKSNTHIFIVFFLIATLFINCKKDEIKDKGVGTFGFFVNGELWEPGYGKPIGKLTYNKNGGVFELKGKPYTSLSYRDFNLYIENIKTVGQYPLKAKKLISGYYSEGIYFRHEGVIYKSRDDSRGELNILTFDIKNKVIAGTFWAETPRKGGASSKIKITKGRFNLRYE